MWVSIHLLDWMLLVTHFCNNINLDLVQIVTGCSFIVLMVEFFQIFRASNYVIQFTHGLYHVVEWSQEIIFIISKISILALELCKKLQVLEISLNRLRDLYQSIPRDGFSRKKIFSECEVMCDYIESRFLEIRRLRVENQRFLTQDLWNSSLLINWL